MRITSEQMKMGIHSCGVRRNIFLFLFFAAIIFFAYRDCFDIYIPSDNSLQYMFALFEDDPLTNTIKDAQEGALYLATLPLLYVLYLFFGTTAAYWTITALTLHALNSFLVFLVSEKIINRVFRERSGPLCVTALVKRSGWIAFFVALVFLISPYQTENIFWISFNRLFHAAVSLLGWLIFVRYLEDASYKKILSIHLLFLLALFSYESTLVFPLIYFAIFILFHKLFLTQVSLKKFFVQIIFPQIFLILGYFLVSKLLTGHWIWHAGPIEDSVQTFNWIKSFLKYYAKFFLFYRYLPVGTIDDFFRTLSENFPLLMFLFILLLSGFIFLFIKLIQYNKAQGYFLLMIFVCFNLSLIPFLSLDTSFLKYIYPDRYGYLSSFFFYLFLVPLVFFLLSRIAVPLFTGYAVLCYILLTQTLPLWKATGNFCDNMIREYEPFLKYDKVYILNIPAYCYGIVTFRSSFAQTIYMWYDKPRTDIEVIAGCYYESLADSLFSVTKIDSGTFEVKGFLKRTPYFSTNAGWPESSETDLYKVSFDTSGCSYILAFKQKIPENSVLIYSTSNGWKKAE